MRIVVVGAGVAGAHAAMTLLEQGCDVQLWDVGRTDVPTSHSGTTFHGLKGALEDPVSYFLGEDLRGIVSPASGELLKYPPHRRFLATTDDELWPFRSDTFFPFVSFCAGGLANGWGANALSFDDDDMKEWPIGFSDLERAYRTVYGRVAVAGPQHDDLTPFFAGVYPSQPPVKPSAADQRLLRAYSRRKGRLNKDGVYLGLSRLAVATVDTAGGACDYCGRCLWGCPHGAIYNPALHTLPQCKAYPGFTYVPGRLVLDLAVEEGKIVAIRYLHIASDRILEEPCDAVFLAAGALQTGAIFLRTARRARPDLRAESEGLMDTQVIKIPYLSLAGLGTAVEERSFQFNRLLMGIVDVADGWPRYLHGELLHLNNLLYHPLIDSLPFDARLSKKLFFALRSAIGALTIFYPDRIVDGNKQVLVDEGGRWPVVRLDYRKPPRGTELVGKSLAVARRALLRMGCVPGGEVEAPPGAGIHYAGTVPMGDGPHRCSASGRSNLFDNLFIADGAAFPSLPSKSITLSLAAHATRVALESLQ